MAATPLLGRRAVLGVLAGGGLAAGFYGFRRQPDADTVISAPEAQRALLAGRMILVDIRRPDEWQETGIAAGASPIDMRDQDFIAQLDRATGGNTSRPIALICARGVRSRRTAARLQDAGYTAILDVSEGMLGSSQGAGWIARGLPLSPYAGK